MVAVPSAFLQCFFFFWITKLYALNFTPNMKQCRIKVAWKGDWANLMWFDYTYITIIIP